MNEIQIITSQNVLVNFTLGTVGHRLLAFIIDCIIKSLYMYAVIFIISELEMNYNDIFLMYVCFILLIPIYFYTLLSEIYMQGQTIGKRIMGIRVVKIDGFAAGSSELFLRWALNDFWLSFAFSGIFYSFFDKDAWFLLAIPLIFLADFIMLATSKYNQRLGDIVAGTTTVSVKKRTNINQTILVNLSEDYQPKFSSVIKLTDSDARIIKEAFVNAHKINDLQTMKKLRDRIVMVIEADDSSMDDKTFVATVMRDFNYYTQNMV